MANILTREFTISSYDVSPRGQARLTTMANFFQEVAHQHASALGLGYHEMKSKKITWVLSRMRIRMERYPLWNETIRLETWPSGAERLFALRDFRVLDHSGALIGMASTAWLILDIDSRRLIRPREMLDQFKMIIHDVQMFETPLGKIDAPGEMNRLDVHTVAYSDLDIMGHVNNVKYMEWCIDAVTSEENTGQENREIEINFNHEAVMGDRVEISGNEHTGGVYYFKAIRESDGQEIISVRLLRD